jgi:hypothetical protein
VKVAKLQICRMWMALCTSCRKFRVLLREVSARAFRVFPQKITNGCEGKHPLCKGHVLFANARSVTMSVMH